MDDREIKGRAAIARRRAANFLDEARSLVLREELPLAASFAVRAEAMPLRDTIGLERRPIREGEAWGRDWESGYFFLEAEAPASWAGGELVARLDFGGEALVYSAEGEPLCGLTNGSAFAEHYAKDIYRITRECRGGERVALYVEAVASGLFGLEPARRPVSRADPARHGSRSASLAAARLALFDAEAWGLALDLEFLIGLHDALDPRSVRAARILAALLDSACAWRGRRSDIPACRAALAAELAKPASASALATTAVGHAHIDTAWLWRTRETRRKVARTFASQLELVERYPGYVFGASAPRHYRWLKEDHPRTYERVREAVRAGRWEPQGAMWLEADCNLVSGESLARQFLKGQAFWRREFGLRVDTCWIPDVFGYPASLPQIMRRSGVGRFLTQKMSWSKLNEFPHDSFVWRGIDGSEVLTHFPPEYTYNSYCDPAGLRRAEDNFHEKDRLDEFMTLMGMGDGGGGPKDEHLEHAMRARSAEGLPRVSFGGSRAFFDRLEARRGGLETWDGELYLEYHRGTYTTQARTKRNNRRLEEELRAAEALAACLPAASWPRGRIDAAVDTLLLHQFHDIIPGSSVHAVYEDAEPAYAEAFRLLAEIEAEAAAALLAEEPGALAFFNCLSSPFEGLVEIPAGSGGLVDAEGSPVPAQADPAGAVARVVLPALGFAAYGAALGATSRDEARNTASHNAPVVAARPASGEALVLENDLVRYRFEADGRLVEARDKELGRDILRAAGNALILYQDEPHDFEAWDVDHYYARQVVEEARAAAAPERFDGPLRSGIRFELALGDSGLRQYALLAEGSKALEFRTRVEWREARRMLRVSFPAAVAAREALCEIPFGFVARPTHASSEWDFAKFEVCAHRWVDVSEEGFGLALLNDCKYGHSLRDRVLGLTLLRSPLHPDPDADQGSHEFSYVLYPHAGRLVDSGAIEAAAALNRPPLAFADRGPAAGGLPVAPIALEGAGSSLEALRMSEEGDCLVARIVETRGRRMRIRLTSRVEGARARETDITEIDDGPVLALPLESELGPFEIRSYKILGSRG